MGNSVRQSDESAARPRPPIWRASTRSSCGTAESIGMLIYDDDDDDQASAFTSHAREGKETHNAVPHAWQPIEDGLRIRHRSLGPSATASHRVTLSVITLHFHFFLFLLLLLPVLLLGRRHGCRSRWRWCRPKRIQIK